VLVQGDEGAIGFVGAFDLDLPGRADLFCAHQRIVHIRSGVETETLGAEEISAKLFVEGNLFLTLCRNGPHLAFVKVRGDVLPGFGNRGEPEVE